MFTSVLKQTFDSHARGLVCSSRSFIKVLKHSGGFTHYVILHRSGAADGLLHVDPSAPHSSPPLSRSPRVLIPGLLVVFGSDEDGDGGTRHAAALARMGCS